MSNDAQFPGALWMPHAHYWPGRSNHRIRYVIIHGTASPGLDTAEKVARYFQTTGRETGTHYIIGKDGHVVQCVREEDSAWGNGILSAGADPWWGGKRGNPNLETVSIEHVKTGAHNEESLTPAQMDASFRLVAYLVRKYNIPPRTADAVGGVTGHFSINPIDKRFCPGLYPWEELWHQLLAPAEYPGIPTGYVPTTSLGYVNAVPNSQTPDGGGSGGGALRSAGTQAHTVLQNAPGFAGIVDAVDAGEQFRAKPIESPADVFSWLGTNLFAATVRLLIILLGFGLIVGLLIAMAQRNDWLGDAGADVFPIALGGA